MNTQARETKVRRQAKRAGYMIKKSRIKNCNADNHGGYMVLDPNLSAIIRGARFDMSLEDLEDLFTD